MPPRRGRDPYGRSPYGEGGERSLYHGHDGPDRGSNGPCVVDERREEGPPTIAMNVVRAPAEQMTHDAPSKVCFCSVGCASGGPESTEASASLESKQPDHPEGQGDHVPGPDPCL